MFFKVSVLKNFAICIVKHLQLYLKETPTEVFTSEYHEICNSFLSFFYRAPLVAASTLTNVKMINYSGAREVARTPVNIYNEQLCNNSYRLLIIFDKLFMFAGSLRSNHRRCCVRKGVIRNFAKFIWKHLCQSLFFNKVEAFNFIEKDTLAQVFSCKFWEISKNTFFTEHLHTTASLKWN